jgi:hypothetical protein
MCREGEVILTGMPAFVLIPTPVMVTTLEVALNILAMLCNWRLSFVYTWVMVILYQSVIRLRLGWRLVSW